MKLTNHVITTVNRFFKLGKQSPPLIVFNNQFNSIQSNVVQTRINILIMATNHVTNFLLQKPRDRYSELRCSHLTMSQCRIRYSYVFYIAFVLH